MTTVYLDNNATTAIDPRVANVMLAQLLDGPTNASSQHAYGRRSRSNLDAAVEAIGSCLGTRLDQPKGARLEDSWLSFASQLAESVHDAVTRARRGPPPWRTSSTRATRV